MSIDSLARTQHWPFSPATLVPTQLAAGRLVLHRLADSFRLSWFRSCPNGLMLSVFDLAVPVRSGGARRLVAQATRPLIRCDDVQGWKSFSCFPRSES
jgi:hypothetical protein